MTPGGTETVLYSFCGKTNCSDGSDPNAALTIDSKGNLYSTNPGGGPSGAGIVYELSPAGKETILYSFCAKSNCSDGWQPQSPAIRDAAGNFYGTTLYGGANTECTDRCGTVFKLAPDGTETVLHSFCAQSGCSDGSLPYGTLIMDANGILYGTTYSNGAHGGGTVFELPK